jgi:hypothetical protein
MLASTCLCYQYNLSAGLLLLLLQMPSTTMTWRCGCGSQLHHVMCALTYSSPVCLLLLLLPAADGIDYDDLAVRLRLRGSSSARLFAKKSFALRTLDQSANIRTAEDNKVSLLGE